MFENKVFICLKKTQIRQSPVISDFLKCNVHSNKQNAKDEIPLLVSIHTWLFRKKSFFTNQIQKYKKTKKYYLEPRGKEHVFNTLIQTALEQSLLAK